MENRPSVSAGVNPASVPLRRLVHFAIARLYFVGYRALRLMEWLISCTRTGKATFLPAAELGWTSALEAHWTEVRRELEPILTNLAAVPNYQDLSKAQEMLSADDRWKSFLLYVAPRPIEKNCARCPATAELLQKIPGLLFAMFSILDGPKHIPPHRGPYKGLLNCHLPLLVPSEPNACRLRVGDDVATWEEGRMLIFDDSHEHEAWNDSESVRVVLLCYVARPLRFPLSALNRVVIRLIRRSPQLREFAERERRVGAKA
jgi:aspartyl/asparaginyl beta-hydroxylase (cupin superfamily)